MCDNALENIATLKGVTLTRNLNMNEHNKQTTSYNAMRVLGLIRRFPKNFGDNDVLKNLCSTTTSRIEYYNAVFFKAA